MRKVFAPDMPAFDKIEIISSKEPICIDAFCPYALVIRDSTVYLKNYTLAVEVFGESKVYVSAPNMTCSAHDTSVVVSAWNTQITAYDNAYIFAIDNSSIIAYDNSRVYMQDFCFASVHHDAVLRSCGNSFSRVFDRAQVALYDTARTDVCGSAFVEAGGYSQVYKAHPDAAIALRQSARLIEALETGEDFIKYHELALAGPDAVLLYIPAYKEEDIYISMLSDKTKYAIKREYKDGVLCSETTAVNIAERFLARGLYRQNPVLLQCAVKKDDIVLSGFSPFEGEVRAKQYVVRQEIPLNMAVPFGLFAAKLPA